MGLTDWLYTNVFGGDALATQGRSLDAAIAAADAPLYSPGGRDYTSQNAATVAKDLFTGSYDQQIKQNQGLENTPGIGSVLTDIFVLGLVGGAIWLFFKLDGASLIKRVAGKGKWFIGGLALAGGLLAWFVYSRLKKTASDANSTAQGLSDAIKTLNPLS